MELLVLWGVLVWALVLIVVVGDMSNVPVTLRGPVKVYWALAMLASVGITAAAVGNA